MVWRYEKDRAIGETDNLLLGTYTMLCRFTKAENIEPLTRAVFEALQSEGLGGELIIVDDNSQVRQLGFDTAPPPNPNGV